MNNYFEEIKKKLMKQIKIEEINIINNSDKHKTHRFFDPEKFHLRIKLKSNYLNSLPRIEAQKIVMNILKDDLKKKIHALEISIEK